MKTPKQKEFLRLVNLYLSGKGTARENGIVEQYFEIFSNADDILEQMNSLEIDEIGYRIKLGIESRIKKSASPLSLVYRRYISVAAALLVFSAITMITYRNYFDNDINHNVVSVADIVPGSNKAILTLSDGRKLTLSDQHNGQIALDGSASVTKTGEGSIVYHTTNSSPEESFYNSISTPRGGQYQLTLPDGSRVWLNAASTLRYPVGFTGKERRVNLTGEAYFEVAKNVAKPFKVICQVQTVEVLGTHFNINAYADESYVKTTLLEGRVKIFTPISYAQTLLKPGQQASIQSYGQKQMFFVKDVDAEDAVTWKNGYFLFDDESLSDILRKVSRWYDVDIKYQDENNFDKISFSGTISKYSNISKVLKKLELTGSVHFKVEGRRVLVMQ